MIYIFLYAYGASAVKSSDLKLESECVSVSCGDVTATVAGGGIP